MREWITLVRTGTFNVTQQAGTNHCGVLKQGYLSQLKVQYEVVCECSSSSLDCRGFLFEQTGVDKYFQQLGKAKSSCELMATNALNDLVKQIKKENPKCKLRRIKVRLSPDPFQASISVFKEWVK